MEKSREQTFFKTLLWAAMVLACFLVVQSAVAQLTTATISGAVKDTTGGVIPGVAITVTNIETGLTRSGTTDTGGFYRFSALPVGTYEVRAEQPGFQRDVKSGLRLAVGQDAVINITLQVGAVEQTVAVTAEAPLVDTTSATVSGLVNQNEVRDLPLNARDLVRLATLFPGVTISKTAGVGISTGFGTHLSIMGTRYYNNAFQLDGQNINDATQVAGGVAGILMGVETVREFNVITSGYSAEYGQHTGGVFNAISKSGTNSLHGSVFEYLRNDKMDARNFFDRDPSNPTVRSDPAPYKRNQFGFTLGGPIIKDRTFFFGSYEGLRQRLGIPQSYIVPNAGLRKGILPNPATGAVQTIPVNPEIQPFLDSYPLPNERDFGDGTGAFLREISEPTKVNFFTVKVDHTFSEKNSLFGRFTRDRSEVTTNTGLMVASGDSTATDYVALGGTVLISPTIINVWLLAYNRSNMELEPLKIAGFAGPRDSFTTHKSPTASISVSGLSGWGGNTQHPYQALLNQYQLKNDLFYNRERHSLKFGFNAQKMQFKRENYNSSGGSFSFTNISNFLRGTANDFTGLMPDSIAASYPQNWLFGLYAQDDIRLSPRLMLNLGMRYEFITTWFVKHGRVSNLRNFFTPGQTIADVAIGNPWFLNPSLRNFAPRVGFAWDPTGSGKTSIRGGAGIFYEQILGGNYANAITNSPPFFQAFNIKDPRFPTAFFDQLASATLPLTRPNPFQYTAQQPTTFKYSLDVQRQVLANTSAELGFSATRSWHVPRVLAANVRLAQLVDGRLFIPSTAGFLSPAFGRIRPTSTDSTTNFFAFRTQINQRYTSGLMFRVAYTFSKVTDDSSNFKGSSDFSSPGSARYSGVKDKGLASFDIRHALTTSFTYDLPGNNLEGAAGKVLGGWQTSGIFTVQSGTPFDISSGASPSWFRNGEIGDYPDLAAAGAKVEYNTRNPDRYFEPSAFTLQPAGFVGNLARNFGEGPGIVQLDFVLSKSIPLKENVNLHFRTEMFNLFNRANFGEPSHGVYSAQTRLASPTIGRITSASPSRQLQLALRLEF